MFWINVKCEIVARSKVIMRKHVQIFVKAYKLQQTLKFWDRHIHERKFRLVVTFIWEKINKWNKS